MKTPPLLLGMVILFWSWQVGLLFLGVPMALVIESARLVTWRWNFSAKDFNRIADLCALIFLAVLVYRLFVDQSANTLLGLLQIMPIPFFPILASQFYGALGGIDTSALFYASRQRHKKNPDLPRIVVDIGYPFAIICVLAASAANMRTTFWIGFFGLAIWALWTVRPRRYGIKVWIAFMLVAAGAGWGGQVGLQGLQQMVEQAVMDWYDQSMQSEVDAYKTITGLGDTGRLKLSHNIIMRILGKPGEPAPSYLRSATYSTYFSGNWVAKDARFTPAAYDHGRDRWFYARPPESSQEVTLTMFLKHGKGLLSVPNGSYEVLGLGAKVLEHNPYGAILVDYAPGLVVFTVGYGDCTTQVRPPGPEDLRIPSQESGLIFRQLQSLDLEGKSDSEKVRAIEGFFGPEFKYSLELLDRGNRKTALTRFLLDTQKGHCEYYATATTMLLREAGIPARYATGYSVQESDPYGQWIIRSRHAHAWVLAFVDGHWVDVDTTPGIWAEVDQRGASYFQGIYDGFSWAWWRLTKWRLEDSKDGKGIGRYLIWILLPLLAFLGWRLFIKERVKGRKRQSKQDSSSVFPGMDSEFFLVEKRFAQWGFARRTGENLSCWLIRLEGDFPGDPGFDRLREIVALHNQYRFNPHGMEKNDRNKLAGLAKNWLESYPDLPESNKERSHHGNI